MRQTGKALTTRQTPRRDDRIVTEALAGLSGLLLLAAAGVGCGVDAHSIAAAGAACDDGDPGTVGDVYDNAGSCAGYVYCSVHPCGAVPPTGQTECYDDTGIMACASGPCDEGNGAFCGQDADYASAARRYFPRSVTGADHDRDGRDDVVVFDGATRDLWAGASVHDRSRGRADDYCESLNYNGGYGGRTDWRVPSLHELMNLIDFGRQEAPVTAFPGIDANASWYWSASSTVVDSSRFFRVSLATGDIRAALGTTIADARCIAGGVPLGGDEYRYAVSGDGDEQTVADRATGLTWQGSDATVNPAGSAAAGQSWRNALAHCQALEYAGHDDWRLPNLNELRSLVDSDMALYDPASLFPRMPAASFWSSTTCAAAPGDAFTVDFAEGVVQKSDKSATRAVRCVMD
jgi:hypothetical protein